MTTCSWDFILFLVPWKRIDNKWIITSEHKSKISFSAVHPDPGLHVAHPDLDVVHLVEDIKVHDVCYPHTRSDAISSWWRRWGQWLFQSLWFPRSLILTSPPSVNLLVKIQHKVSVSLVRDLQPGLPAPEALANIVKPKPKVQSPKVKTNKTWADTIIICATLTITFKHEGMLW